MNTIDIEELLQDGLSKHDLMHLTDIIKSGYGDWYHARLMRALHALLPYADANHMQRLEQAYPGSVATYRIWYNEPRALAQAVEEAQQ